MPARWECLFVARLGDRRTQSRHAIRPIRAGTNSWEPVHWRPRRSPTTSAAAARWKDPWPIRSHSRIPSRGPRSSGEDKERDIAFSAVETISTAFMGMTVGCAKCHDHKFDPITQKDFYAMKAIFDPLTLKNVMLATPAQIFEAGQKLGRVQEKSVHRSRAAIEEADSANIARSCSMSGSHCSTSGRAGHRPQGRTRPHAGRAEDL